jgi:hypothetical protein
MTSVFVTRRIELLQARLGALASSLDRARTSVERLEREPVPAGATAQARAARLSAARAMAATLSERDRQMRIAIGALQAELAS